MTLTLSALTCLTMAAPARADVLIIAPHPDDDVITAAGVAMRAAQAGEVVRVLYMTNGDIAGLNSALERQDEAVRAQALLGVPEDNLIFLGYPDGRLQDLRASCLASSNACQGPSGLTTTFGDRGLGRRDYHRHVFGASANNNGTNVRTDLTHVLNTYRPSDIFVTSEYDQHPDHATTYQFLIDALASAVATSPSYRPAVHKTIVWNDFGNQAAWPAAPDPTTFFTEPPNLLSRTGLVWSARESLDVPLAAQISPVAIVNAKARAIASHATQGGYTGSQNGYISAFLHKDEFFWTEPGNQGANRPPVPNAGADQQRSAGQSVQLSGSASFDPNGTGLTYQWRQVAGPSVALSSSMAAQPTFTVPAATTTPTAFAFELKVSDGVFNSVADGVTVLVNTSTLPLPPGSNVAVIASASASSEAGGQAAGKAIDGNTSGFTPSNPSNSAHEWASNGEAVGAWLQLSWPTPQVLDRVRLFDRPNTDDNVVAGRLTFSSGAAVDVGALSNTAGVEVTFTPRSVTWVRFQVLQVGPQTYSVGLAELEAYSTGSTPPPAVNLAPSAIAGPSQTVTAGALVSLSGSGTDPEAASLSYSWSQLSGTPVTLSSASAQNPSFTAPVATSSAQLLSFRLVVNDGSLNSTNNATTTITVPAALGGNLPPLANAGSAQTVQANALVALNGSASSDPEGAALSYAWSQLSGPSVLLSSASAASPSFVSPSVGSGAQALVFQLIVRDASLASAPATVTITLPGANLALLASVSASSAASNRAASRAIDGDVLSEWVATQTTGAWIQLGWPSARTISQVSLYGLLSSTQRVTAGTLTFSSGSSVSVGSLPSGGTARTQAFPSRSVTWIRFTVTGVSSTTTGAGLGEFSVFNTNQPPSVSAGADFSVTGLQTVILGGSASDPEGTALSYTWTQVAGPSVALSGSGASRSFSAPTAGPSAQQLRFQLRVSDSAGALSADEVIVTVAAAAPNLAPTAAAGADQNVSGGATVSLTGSGTDPEGSVLSYAWTQLSGPGVTLAGSGATRTFAAPVATTSAQTLSFRLTVSDGSLSSTDDVNITVAASAPPPPPPPAGGTNLALTATATASSPTAGSGQDASKVRDGFTDGYPTNASHEWASNGQGVGAWVQLSWASALTLNQVRLFDRPNTDDNVRAGVLRFSDGSTLAVSALDNAGAGLTLSFAPRTVSSVRFEVTQVSANTYNVGLAELQVYNSDANLAPSANAGAAQTVAQGALVTLHGSASSDPEGAPLSYDWTQTLGPAVLSVENVQNPTFIAPSSGGASDLTLSFELVVSDGPNSSSVATTQVTVLGAGAPPPPPPPPGGTNLALTATASASSSDGDQTPNRAIDGFLDGYPTNYLHEWSSRGEGVGGWIQLNWASAQTLSQITLFDRPNSDDNVLAGTLTFSNGTSVAVGALPNTSGSLSVSFSARSVSWVRFTATQVSANTYNVGLAELEAR